MSALKSYKQRWESIADLVGYTDNLSEVTQDQILITYSSDINPLNYKRVIYVSSIANITHLDLRRAILEPIVNYTKDIDEARQWLNSLPELFTYDCETTNLPYSEDTEQYPDIQKDWSLNPFRNQFTMWSFATNEEEAFVISNESQEMEDLVMNFLTSTTATVIMHNASFDMQVVTHRTNKTITNFEDTQLLAWTYLNNTNTAIVKVGLKPLAGEIYGEWAVAKDLFGIENKYNPDMIRYSGIDAMATMYVWNKFSSIEPRGEIVSFQNLLPIPEPKDYAPPRRYFYENALKPMVPHAIRLMLNGIRLDMQKVADLDKLLIEVLKDVDTNLANNKLIKQFQQVRFEKWKIKQSAELESKKRSIDYYKKPYKPTDAVHISYVVNEFLVGKQCDFTYIPTGVLPNGDLRWTLTDVKKFLKHNTFEFLTSVANKSVDPSNPIINVAMVKLAVYKSNNYNISYDEKIALLSVDQFPAFNPGSSNQKKELFAWLNVEPLSFSKDTGEASWGREQVQEVQQLSDDEDIIDICQQFIDHSFGAIVKRNFINGFYKFTVGDVLHGNLKLAGALSARPTSNKINLLNLPSTRSIYSKPIKKCMIPHEGDLIFTIDLNALEDRVIGSLSKDTNKIRIVNEGYDGHVVNAIGYFKDEVEAILGPSNDSLEYNKRFKEATKSDPRLDAIRSKSKQPTFGLAYGAYPPKVASTLKIPIDEAERIFNSYHNEIYPGVTKYREDYVLPTTKEQGYLHLLLGLRLNTDDADKYIRTLANASVQSFSLITLIAMCRMNELIDEAGYTDDIKIISTIYDSLYYSITPDPEIIRWMNENIVREITRPYIIDEAVPNGAEGEIGSDFANLHETPNNATATEIAEIMNNI
jgi:DNA polymerase I-like protein with 3'-5' exonuclease and polymerase domains